jgi:hypothetical protein
MLARRAGQYARQTTTRKKRTALAALAAMIVVAVAIAIAADFAFVPLISAETFVIVGTLLLDRFVAPALERWGRGAAGEENVGRLLTDLEPDGWLATHDVNTGRGNIDTIVLGPGGIFTIEVKSHGGKLRPDRIDPAMLRQAYAQSKWLERVIGQPTTALLVFSRAISSASPSANSAASSSSPRGCWPTTYDATRPSSPPIKHGVYTRGSRVGWTDGSRRPDSHMSASSLGTSARRDGRMPPCFWRSPRSR